MEQDVDEKGAVGIESIRQSGFNALFMSEEEQEKCLYKGGKIKVRLLDDDGNVCYHAVVDETDFSCELLLDWGMSYAGCTRLDLKMEHWIEESNGCLLQNK
ncbi:hypothetical protein, partial [Heyndrickxia ginsengihumi]|uniref:hypothetical protein n=1 Tax=Heyndrickxia ginsengihumi TaxID=363870 RepID=UPI003D1CBEF5